MSLPILIVGAGPTGLCLATALAKRGIRSEVFESLPELSREARASTFHPRTLEMLHEWGVLGEIVQRGHKVHRLQFWERETRELIAQFDYDAIKHDTHFPFRLQCPQSILTRVLKPLVEQTGLCKVHFSHKLIDLVDTGNHVEARLETPDGARCVSGQIVCGADGSRSAARRALDISFEGKTYEDRFLLVACDLDFKPIFGDFGPVSYLFDPREWVIVLHLPDVTRVVFRLRDDEDEIAAQQPHAVRERIRRFINSNGNPHSAHRSPPTVSEMLINDTSVYKVHQRVAETFHKGNVVLLGDAAHINNPMGGMGMNSGIHDAYHLASAIMSSLKSGGNYLAEWATARRAFALSDVQPTTDKNYVDMSAQDETYRLTRNRELREIASDPKRARAYLLRAAMMEERI
jgi:3-(3-hydroxy-phenyl)propionate hydroxylase